MLPVSPTMEAIFTKAKAYCIKNGIEKINLIAMMREILSCNDRDLKDAGLETLIKLNFPFQMAKVKLDIDIKSYIPNMPVLNTEEPKLDEDAFRIVRNAREIKERNITKVGTGEIILAALKDDNNYIASFLAGHNITYDKFYKKYFNIAQHVDIASTDNVPTSESLIQAPMLEQFSSNLVALARENKLDPVVGRDEEIANVIAILSRRKKNNPILVGPAGSGKTAIVEGLAIKIAENKVPMHLANKVVYLLDMTMLVAGCKFRGDFEQRIAGILKECERDPRIVIFVDEIHMIISAGNGDEDGFNLSNVIKPALSRGKMRMIGATTLEEYDRTIYKNAALRRRFDKVTIEELTGANLEIVIKSTFESYSKEYGIGFDTSLIKHIIDVSKYINDNANPDKCVDVIDRAFANLNVEINDLSSLQTDEVDKGKLDVLKKSMIQERYKTRKLELRDILQAASVIAKIPIKFLDVDSDMDYIDTANRFFKRRIINQEQAIEVIMNVIIESKMQINDPNRPRAVIYLDGPEGVGKSELAYLLAEVLLGDREKLYRLDLATMKDKMMMTKLTGAAPGYVGYNEANNDMTTYIRRNNVAVVLLDEIDSCAPEILDYFISAFERGYIEDNHSRRINLNNTYFILTGNITSKIIRGKNSSSLGFQQDSENKESKAITKINEKLSAKFRDRIDKIVVVNDLENEHIDSIIKLKIEYMNSYISNIKFDLTPKAIEFIRRQCSDGTGARRIGNSLKNHIHPLLTKAILNKKNFILIDCKDDTLEIKEEITVNG